MLCIGDTSNAFLATVSAPIALAEGGLLLVGILIVIFLGVAYGYFTRTGSGIDAHPSDGLDGAPGAEGQSEASGKDQGESSALDTHGTQ